MQKLPTFDSTKYEFTYFVVMTIKNASAIEAISVRLNAVAETINELTDRDSSVDLETFKATFLKELATLLNKNTEFEFSNSLFDLLGTERTELKNSFSSLELQFQALTEKVSKIESVLGREKVVEGEKPNIFDLLV